MLFLDHFQQEKLRSREEARQREEERKRAKDEEKLKKAAEKEKVRQFYFFQERIDDILYLKPV